MLKYVSKFVLDILPSLVATVIGAYIVNHYIIPKSASGSPPVAAAVSTLAVSAPTAGAKPADPVAESVAVETAPKAKPTEKPVEKAAAEKIAADKTADKPSETASIPVESRRKPAPSREKNVAKTNTVPVPAPVVAAPMTVPADNATAAPDERRDAGELARAAIERLRGSGEATSHTARGPVTEKTAPPPTVQALPPAIMVSTPRNEPYDFARSSTKSGDAVGPQADDSRRPPAEIPVSRPLDLHAEAATHERTTVAEDMLTAAKSMFQAVLPR